MVIDGPNLDIPLTYGPKTQWYSTAPLYHSHTYLQSILDATYGRCAMETETAASLRLVRFRRAVSGSGFCRFLWLRLSRSGTASGWVTRAACRSV